MTTRNLKLHEFNLTGAIVQYNSVASLAGQRQSLPLSVWRTSTGTVLYEPDKTPGDVGKVRTQLLLQQHIGLVVPTTTVHI
jgi:hypothetical protein